MLHPFISVLHYALHLYSLAIFIYFIMMILIQFGALQAHHPLISQIMNFFRAIIDPVLNRIRGIVKPVGGFDLSPLVLLLLIHFAQSALISWF